MSRRRLKNTVLLVMVAALALSIGAPPLLRASERAEQLKVAFIYNFLKYVKWPEEALEASGGALQVCVIGSQEFYDRALLLQSRSAQSRKIKVVERDDTSSLDQCQLAYLSGSEQWIGNMQRNLAHLPVLTVSETRGATDIAIYQQSDKIQFEVNIGSTRQKGLSCSSQLLKVAAEIVGR